MTEISVTVNGVVHRADVAPRMTLVDFLRDVLRQTGTHVGCEHGICGACSVIFDGLPVRSCLMFAVQADGHEILTVEGLSEPDGTLGDIPDAFWECHAMQCGYCTPGMMIAAHALRLGLTVVTAPATHSALVNSGPRSSGAGRARRGCAPTD